MLVRAFKVEFVRIVAQEGLGLNLDFFKFYQVLNLALVLRNL